MIILHKILLCLMPDDFTGQRETLLELKELKHYLDCACYSHQKQTPEQIHLLIVA